MLPGMDCSSGMAAVTWCYWAIAVASASATLVLPWAASLSQQGKTRPATAAGWTVPKAWFAHFYYVALSWTASLACALALGLDPMYWFAELWFSAAGLCDTAHREPLQDERLMLVLGLFAVHAARRAIESRYVTIFSEQARMHVISYLVGITFYLATPWTFYMASFMAHKEDSDASAGPLDLALHALVMCGFWVGSVQQFRSHRALAELRSAGGSDAPRAIGSFFMAKEKAAKSGQYFLPRGGWFDYVSCPHYFAELIIYASFLLAYLTSPLVWAVFVFVCLTMVSASRESHAWYRTKFKDSYPPERRALIPRVY